MRRCRLLIALLFMFAAFTTFAAETDSAKSHFDEAEKKSWLDTIDEANIPPVFEVTVGGATIWYAVGHGRKAALFAHDEVEALKAAAGKDAMEEMRILDMEVKVYREELKDQNKLAAEVKRRMELQQKKAPVKEISLRVWTPTKDGEWEAGKIYKKMVRGPSKEVPSELESFFARVANSDQVFRKRPATTSKSFEYTRENLLAKLQQNPAFRGMKQLDPKTVQREMVVNAQMKSAVAALMGALVVFDLSLRAKHAMQPIAKDEARYPPPQANESLATKHGPEVPDHSAKPGTATDGSAQTVR